MANAVCLRRRAQVNVFLAAGVGYSMREGRGRGFELESRGFAVSCVEFACWVCTYAGASLDVSRSSSSGGISRSRKPCCGWVLVNKMLGVPWVAIVVVNGCDQQLSGFGGMVVTRENWGRAGRATGHRPPFNGVSSPDSIVSYELYAGSQYGRDEWCK